MAPSASKTWPKIPKKVVLGISVYPEQITSVGILRRGPVPDNRCPTHQQRALVFRRNMQSHMDDAPTDPVEIQKVSPLPCLPDQCWASRRFSLHRAAVRSVA